MYIYAKDMAAPVMIALFIVFASFLETGTAVVNKFEPIRSSKQAIPQNIIQGIVHIDGSATLAYTDDDFICATMDWWTSEKCDYGVCSWGSTSLLNMDLNNKVLLNAVKAFSPLKIRLGGTLQDKVIYQIPGDNKPCNQFVKRPELLFGFSQGCLPMSRWDQLNNFFKMTGAKVTFGLNALYGKKVVPNGVTMGPWDSTNAESLIRYTVGKNYTIFGWELGNELSGSGIGTSIPADQYAADVAILHNLIQNIYQNSQIKPLVIGPGGFFDPAWFSKFISQTSNSLQVVSHHIYNLGPGVDNHLVHKILNPVVLNQASKTFSGLQGILQNARTPTVAWVSEAGGAYNSGRNLVSNTFVNGFWYLDQLGMSSIYNTKTYCRQTLIGGNYGLLNTATYVPNPDYYSALLWHRLMGSKVLSTRFTRVDKLRTYAHCSKNSPGITVLLMNLDANTTKRVVLSVAKAMKGNVGGATTRDEYHLTPNNGDVRSQTVLLNGKVLAVEGSGMIPPLVPNKVNTASPITVAPFSIVFVKIPTMLVPACK